MKPVGIPYNGGKNRYWTPEQKEQIKRDFDEDDDDEKKEEPRLEVIDAFIRVLNESRIGPNLPTFRMIIPQMTGKVGPMQHQRKKLTLGNVKGIRRFRYSLTPRIAKSMAAHADERRVLQELPINRLPHDPGGDLELGADGRHRLRVSENLKAGLDTHRRRSR